MGNKVISCLVFFVSFCLFAVDKAAPVKKKVASKYEEILNSFKPFDVPDKSDTVVNLKQVYALVLEKSPEVQKTNIEFENKTQEYKAVFRGFIPSATLSSAMSQASTADHSETLSNSVGLSFAGKTDWGIGYSLNMPQLSISQSHTPDISSSFSQEGLNELYLFPKTKSVSSSASADISLPLLQGAPYLVGGFMVKRADLSLEQAKAEKKQAIISALYAAQDAYFQVLQSSVSLRNMEHAHKSTQALYEDLQVMKSLGAADDNELLKVRIQILSSENSLYTTRISYNDVLENFLSMITESDHTKNNIFPDPREVDNVPKKPELDLKKSIDMARENRSDYKQANQALYLAELSKKEAFSALLPSLGFSAQVGSQASDPSVSESLKKSASFEKPNLTLSLSFSYLLNNYGAADGYKAAIKNITQAEIAIEKLNRSLQKEIASSLIEVEMAYRQLEISTINAGLSEKNLSQEFIKYSLGESDIKAVIDVQNSTIGTRIEFMSTKIKVLQAISKYRKSIGLPPEGVEI